MKRSNSTKFTQTWMTTLEEGIKNQKDIDLSVAYYCNASSYEPSFNFEGVHYYPIVCQGCGVIDKIKERFVSLEKQDFVLIKRALDVVDKIRPDIIHIHGTESNFGLLVDYVKDIPIIISLQGFISPIVEKYYAGIPMEVAKSCDMISEYLHQINVSKIYANYRYTAVREQRILQKANYVIGRTEWDNRLLSMMAPQASYYIVNEIVREGFRRARWGKTANDESFIIISILSNGIYKGYEMILKCAKILQKYANFHFEWRVVGCNENYKYVKASKQLTGIKPESVGVKFLGSKQEGELVALMEQSHLYVQVSHIENSPNALCEAMTLGMPCIASHVGGTSTILKNHEEGILYSPGDPYILASEILNAYNSYGKMIDMGQAARKKALERNTPARVVGELFFVYEDVLSHFENEK